MFEHIIQMGPMLILAGVMAGWVAEATSRAGSYGFLIDMAVGLGGSLAVGAIFRSVISRDPAGMLVMFLVGFAGAALVIVAQRSCWRSARLGT
jgi:uncharacterized membrane protein YeaQ/YmgE (transglycosylase-associated protein family)